MIVPNRVRAKKGLHDSLLRRMPKIECSEDTKLVPDSAQGRMYGLARRR